MKEVQLELESNSQNKGDNYANSILEQDKIQNNLETQRNLYEIKLIIFKLCEKWFEPANFESQELYEAFGIRIFKKYMPTSGDFVYQHLWKKLGAEDRVKIKDEKSLQEFVFFTKVYELIHLTFLSMSIAILSKNFSYGDLSAASFTLYINILTNIYPIMVQRYNRLRAYTMIKRMHLLKLSYKR